VSAAFHLTRSRLTMTRSDSRGARRGLWREAVGISVLSGRFKTSMRSRSERGISSFWWPERFAANVPLDTQSLTVAGTCTTERVADPETTITGREGEPQRMTLSATRRRCAEAGLCTPRASARPRQRHG